MGVLVGLGGLARGDAALNGIEVTAVREADCALSIQIDGLIARGETRHVVVNQGDRDTEVVYDFDLPADAAVIGAEITLADGRRARSAAVDSRSFLRLVAKDFELPGAPDVGLLRQTNVSADEGVASYELRLFPIAAGRSATATVRWIAPLRYRDGRLSLRLPDRGGAAVLARERVELVWRAPTGARGLRDLRSGPARLAAATGASAGPLRFSAPAGSDLVLEATPIFSDAPALLADLAVVPTGRDRGAVALSLLAPRVPPAAPPGFERVVVVVDRSASLGTTGLAAARLLSDAILAAANPGAAADAVVFDRRAQAVVGRLSPDRAAVRAALGRALAGAPRGGSDLGEALSRAGGLIRRRGAAADAPIGEVARGVAPPTLIAILTDGMLPLELDGERARSQLGTLALNEAVVVSVLLVPDGAPVPEVDQGPLAELARSTGGRVLIVRHGEARERAGRLWSELAQPAPFDGIRVQWGNGAIVTTAGEAPGRLESGEAALLVGWYHGAAPGPVSVRAELRGRPTAVRVRSAGSPLAGAALPLTLVSRPAIELLPPAELDRPGADERARAEQVRAAHRAGTLTGSTALVILDEKDRFAQDRLALAAKWGTGQYRRFAPPGERRPDESRENPPEETRARAPSGPGPAVARRTGVLDEALVERIMKQHVVPAARACYQAALRREPKLAGDVVIQLEMARGEVQSAQIVRSGAPGSTLNGCLLDAAYATPVPRVALGETSESVVVVRYPLRFQNRNRQIEVDRADDNAPDSPIVDPNDPLGGI